MRLRTTGVLDAASLKRQFDESFTRPIAGEAPPAAGIIGVRIGGDRYAVRAGEVRDIARSQGVTPVPSGARGLLGIAGLRGRVVPVFDLAELLGYPGLARAPAWLLLHGAAEPIAFAVEHFDGYSVVAKGDVYAAEGGGIARAHVVEVARVGSATRPVIRLESMRRELEARVATRGSKER